MKCHLCVCVCVCVLPECKMLLVHILHFLACMGSPPSPAVKQYFLHFLHPTHAHIKQPLPIYTDTYTLHTASKWVK